MKISGRTIAYLLILLIAFAIGGFTFVSAQGFVEQWPLPVEENGIVEVVNFYERRSRTGRICPQASFFVYTVPAGKRLIIEHVTARIVSFPARRSLTPSWIDIATFGSQHEVAFSREGFPVSGGGPITLYVEPMYSVGFDVQCPRQIGVEDSVILTFSFTGRLVPYPHPATIPTATPPP